MSVRHTVCTNILDYIYSGKNVNNIYGKRLLEIINGITQTNKNLFCKIKNGYLG
jgi:hypothetical protein